MLASRAKRSAILSDLKHSHNAPRLQPQEDFVLSTPHPPGVSSFPPPLFLCLSLICTFCVLKSVKIGYKLIKNYPVKPQKLLSANILLLLGA